MTDTKQVKNMRKNGMLAFAFGLIAIPFIWMFVILFQVSMTWFYIMMGMAWVGCKIAKTQGVVW